MLFLAYLGAVFRHWRAAVSGFGALAVSAVVQWKVPGWWPWAWPWAPITPEDPRFWWIVAGCCFVLAMFLAWSDEYKARSRLEADRGCPKLFLKLSPGRPGERRWVLANGGSDAFNVRAEPVRYGRRYAVFRLDGIPGGTEREVSFDIHRKDGTLLAPEEITLDHIFRAILDDKAIPDIRFEERPRIPVMFRYADAFGREFETTCEIYWDLAANDGGVHHGVVRRSFALPRYKPLIPRIFRRYQP
jgi:hypothetical protein